METCSLHSIMLNQNNSQLGGGAQGCWFNYTQWRQLKLIVTALLENMILWEVRVILAVLLCCPDPASVSNHKHLGWVSHYKTIWKSWCDTAPVAAVGGLLSSSPPDPKLPSTNCEVNLSCLTVPNRVPESFNLPFLSFNQFVPDAQLSLIFKTKQNASSCLLCHNIWPV